MHKRQVSPVLRTRLYAAHSYKWQCGTTPEWGANPLRSNWRAAVLLCHRSSPDDETNAAPTTTYKATTIAPASLVQEAAFLRLHLSTYVASLLLNQEPARLRGRLTYCARLPALKALRRLEDGPSPRASSTASRCQGHRRPLRRPLHPAAREVLLLLLPRHHRAVPPEDRHHGPQLAEYVSRGTLQADPY